MGFKLAGTFKQASTYADSILRLRFSSVDQFCSDEMSTFLKSILIGTGALIATMLLILIGVPLCGDTFQTSMFVNGVIGCYAIGSSVSYYCMKQTEKYKAALLREEKLHHELQHTYAQLQMRARLDMMTGLLNRETFLKEMEERKSQQPGQISSVLLLDVDCFKRINDTWGHHAGDDALVQIGGTILSIVGPKVRAGRIGGEEFAVFLPCDDGSEAIVLGEAIRIAVQQISFFPEPNHKEGLTLSFGIACASNAVKTAALLKRADALLYQAKAEGRNRICINQTPLLPTSESVVDKDGLPKAPSGPALNKLPSIQAPVTSSQTTTT